VAPHSGFEEHTYRKVTLRLMPLLFLCYILAYIDRINVGFAKLQMAQDLHMSNEVYGTGAGIFFVGYFLFEVPANILLQKLGAKWWLGSIMIIWGLASTATMFVRSATEFYAVRFLLGVVEAGFFPGVILYLTFWYTRQYRARIIALFMSAIPLSGVLGGGVSGWILENMAGIGGLQSWQWLYCIEGFPPIVAGIVVIMFLDNSPKEAKWLSPEQQSLLARRIEEEEEGKPSKHFLDAFRSGTAWLLCFVFFGFVMASYGLGFWLPQIISETISGDSLWIGLLSMIPWGVGAIAMIVVGRHSDLTGERRWHIAISALVGAFAFALSAVPHISGSLGLLALTVATAGVMAAISTFWALPSGFLSSTAAAAGIALINSVGSLAGYVSPFLVGKVRDATHNMRYPLLVLAASCFMAGLAILGLRTRKQL
jgi:MFS family permease